MVTVRQNVSAGQTTPRRAVPRAAKTTKTAFTVFGHWPSCSQLLALAIFFWVSLSSLCWESVREWSPWKWSRVKIWSNFMETPIWTVWVKFSIYSYLYLINCLINRLFLSQVCLKSGICEGFGDEPVHLIGDGGGVEIDIKSRLREKAKSKLQVKITNSWLSY